MPIRMVEGKSLGQGLPLSLNELRRANFHDLEQAKFDHLVQEGLATKLISTQDQNFIAWSGTGVASPIEFLLGTFPHKNKKSITTFDECTRNELELFRKLITYAVQSVLGVQNQISKEPYGNIIVCQHLGPNETDYLNYHFQSFNQLHLHVFFDPDKDDEKVQYEYGKVIRNGLSEPFWPLITKIVDSLGLPVHSDSSTKSIVITDRVRQLTIEHLELVADCMKKWQSTWNELASCFTEFKTDDLKRYIPSTNEKKLAQFISKFNLDNRSIRLLNLLAVNLQTASENGAPWTWLSKGIFGTINFTYSIPDENWTVELIPRTRVHDARTVLMSKKIRTVLIKDRSQTYSSLETKTFLGNQKLALYFLKLFLEEDEFLR